MQTRLISCLAGGLLGVALTSMVNESLELTPVLAYAGCGGAGLVLGWVVSTLFDVFRTGEDENA